MESFWSKLPRPFFAMAPMADVTDPAWRSLVASYGKPDITWTEFVSADGLYHLNGAAGKAEKSSAQAARPMQHDFSASPANPLMRDLQYSEAERPIVAQFFTSKPEMMTYAAKLAAELGFDGVDINMGCPDRTIEHQGAGAGLIKTPEVAVALIKAAQEASSLPVSVKTRVGYNTEVLEEWLPILLAAKPAAITLHLRTRKEMSLVSAHWELMKKAVAMRERLAPEVLLIGNGDITDLVDARARCAAYGSEGAMIGRGIFGNPWVFAGRTREEIPLAEKLEALTELARRFEALRPAKSFHILKKHIKAFVTGFDGAAELRARLMEVENVTELEAAIVRADVVSA